MSHAANLLRHKLIENMVTAREEKLFNSKGVLHSLTDYSKNTLVFIDKMIRIDSNKLGTIELTEVGRPDLTIENVILDANFKHLFTKETLDRAQERLDLASYFVERKKANVTKETA